MTTVNRWNPVRDMITLREAMDRMFDDNFRARMGAGAIAWTLPVDAFVTDEAIVLKADVPGLKSDDLDVQLEGDTLTVRGEVKPSAEERKYLLRERAFGKFERTMTINTPIDHSKVEASFEDGVLTLTLPKAEAAKPRQIAIKTPTLASKN